jgi:hypothetical protein
MNVQMNERWHDTELKQAMALRNTDHVTKHWDTGIH